MGESHYSTTKGKKKEERDEGKLIQAGSIRYLLTSLAYVDIFLFCFFAHFESTKQGRVKMQIILFIVASYTMTDNAKSYSLHQSFYAEQVILFQY